MTDYYYKNHDFVIENYNQKKPFSNFLPGIAGKMGIPLWAFYVNRGQGIASFGLQDKHHPILPFTPANKAYEYTPISGFRTFIKSNNEIYEPFKVDGNHFHKMAINQYSFTITEVNESLGIKTEVKYYGLPSSPIAGLVRKVKITNISKEKRSYEILDGISEILAAGIQNEAFKSVSNLLASWIDVEHLDRNLAFYTLRSSTGDSSEIGSVEEGNFYIGMLDSKRIRPIVDLGLVFGQNTAKTSAVRFANTPLKELVSLPQVTTNRIPCGFIPIEKTLKANETLAFYSISGHVKNIDVLNKLLSEFSSENYFTNKENESEMVVGTLLEDVKTSSNLPIFDQYIEQNYLDNLLRGGYPIKIGESIYHLYSRRHGDLERDYNFFSLAPEYYSQGAGNFRDVCQNRRVDTKINPEVKDFNIQHFASLIQLDGYNPLSVGGISFNLKEDVDKKALIAKHFDSHSDKLLEFLVNAYTPGNIVNFVERHSIITKTATEDYLNDIIINSAPSINAAFGEGYWVDHFTYILDLVESFESIYPDQMDTLLYEDKKYLYFDSPVSVLPKEHKIVLNGDRKVRQYTSLRHFDEEKITRLNMNRYGSNWSKLGNETYQSNLFVKLLILTLTKHSLLDPEGIGIEMEADKPGWNDAMNGLPGLLGSGVSETIELGQIVMFLLKYIKDDVIEIPYEVNELFKRLVSANSYSDRLKCRHEYREAIRFGLKGNLERLDLNEVKMYLESLNKHINLKLNELYESYDKIIPTFLYYEVTSYEAILKDGKPLKTKKGYELVKPLTYQRKALPKFLEAPARLLKTPFLKTSLEAMYQAILKSDIYDKDLAIYKTSECIENESHEIGRIHAFTKGWLERESNFLHMTYKYLIGLLKAGLYNEFYEAIETNLVCFMDPAVYGRSTLENSSFIAPSNNPDSGIRGQGFFARLSGSTVEVLNMWETMMTGGKPFRYEKEELVFKLEPKLKQQFFKKDGSISFKFLKNTEVTYVNASKENTYDRCEIYRIDLSTEDEVQSYETDVLSGALASNVREGFYKSIKIYMNKI